MSDVPCEHVDWANPFKEKEATARFCFKCHQWQLPYLDSMTTFAALDPGAVGGGNMMEELTLNSKVGALVSWSTVWGQKFEGLLIEWDSNVAIIRLADGSEKAVEC